MKNINDIENESEISDKYKNVPFTVPDDYFDNLTNSIMEKCDAQTGVVAKKRTFWSVAKPIMGFAAGFLLLIGISHFILNMVNVVNPETKNYLSNYTEKDVPAIVGADEMNDEMRDEIISYLVDDQVYPNIDIENAEE